MRRILFSIKWEGPREWGRLYFLSSGRLWGGFYFLSGGRVPGNEEDFVFYQVEGYEENFIFYQVEGSQGMRRTLFCIKWKVIMRILFSIRWKGPREWGFCFLSGGRVWEFYFLSSGKVPGNGEDFVFYQVEGYEENFFSTKWKGPGEWGFCFLSGGRVWGEFYFLSSGRVPGNEEDFVFYQVEGSQLSRAYLDGLCYIVNSLWPGDAIWWQWSGSTLVKVMACYLIAPSHDLNQCWLIIKSVLWHSPESSLTRNAHEPSITCFVITLLKWLPYLTGAIELIHCLNMFNTKYIQLTYINKINEKQRKERKIYTVWSCYNIKFLPIPHNRPHIADLWGWAMECLLLVLVSKTQ